MGKIETYECDQCRRARGEVNRWWIVQIIAEGGFPNVLKLRPMGRVAVEGERTMCSEECLLKEIQQWIEKHRGPAVVGDPVKGVKR